MSAQLDLIPECRIPQRGTQLYDLLMALSSGERLTNAVAWSKYGIYALSQRIGDLKRKYGWPVKSRMIEVRSRSHVAEYWLETRGQNGR